MPICKTCPGCGATFLTYPSKEADGRGKYCSRSCRATANATKHGHGGNTKQTRSKEYRTWNSMLQRCLNPNSKAYKAYGGAGIAVCERWKDFKNFLEDMGFAEDGESIDRIDSSLGYFKENCKWASRLEQQSHLSTSWKIDLDGERLCLSEVARRCGIRLETLRYRLLRGIPVSDAIKPSSLIKTRKIEINGEVVSLAELSRRTGIPQKTLSFRIDKGWPISRVVIR